MPGGSWCGDALTDNNYGTSATLCHNGAHTRQTTGVDNGIALLRGATDQRLWALSYCDLASAADDRGAGHCFVADQPNKANGCGECGDYGDDTDSANSDDSDTEECHDSTDDSDDEGVQEVNDDDNNHQCGVAPPHTAYAHGYTFIEGFVPADWFNALVRPERRLVLLVCGVPVAVDAAEVERAARVDRLLVTPVGSCRLGPTDAERAHEVDESLYGREGIRRALAPVPLAATLEAVGAPAAEAAGGVGGAILAGILAALL